MTPDLEAGEEKTRNGEPERQGNEPSQQPVSWRDIISALAARAKDRMEGSFALSRCETLKESKRTEETGTERGGVGGDMRDINKIMMRQWRRLGMEGRDVRDNMAIAIVMTNKNTGGHMGISNDGEGVYNGP